MYISCMYIPTVYLNISLVGGFISTLIIDYSVCDCNMAEIFTTMHHNSYEKHFMKKLLDFDLENRKSRRYSSFKFEDLQGF